MGVAFHEQTGKVVNTTAATSARSEARGAEVRLQFVLDELV
jgi:hypothetical protein